MKGVEKDPPSAEIQPERVNFEGDICKRIIQETWDSVFAFNPDGTYRFVNPAFAISFGKTPGQIIGKSPHDIFPHEDAERRLEVVNQVFATGEHGEIEVKVVTADCNPRYFLTSVDPVKDKDGIVKYVICISKDITERKKEEDALKESEARFGGLLHNIQSVAVQGYSADGTTQYWNKASEAVYGYSAEEAIGKNLLDLVIPPEMRSDVNQAVKQMAETGQPIPAAELSLLRKDGSRVSVFSNHTIVSIPGKPRELFCLDIDISDRKNAEEALRRSEQRYHEFIEQSLDGVMITDRSGNVSIWNTSMEKITGIPRCNAIGSSICDIQSRLVPENLKTPELIDQLKTMVGNILESKINWKGESIVQEIVSTDGTHKTVHDSSFIIRNETAAVGMGTVLRDITAGKKVEDALRASEEMYRILTENMKDVVSVVDPETMKFLYISPSVENMDGYKAEEVIIQPVENVVTAETAANIVRLTQSRAKDFLTGKEPTWRYYTDEIEHPGKDGPSIWAEVVSRYILNPKSGKVEMHCVSRDITARKKADEEKMNLERQLAQAQKMESIGVLAGGVAHDFNNMLASILLTAEMMKEGIDPNSSLAQDLKDIHEAARKGASLTRALLAFSRTQTLQITRANLNAVINDFMPLLKRIVGEDINIHQSMGTNLWDSMVDTGQIERIITNLVTNARHAMPKGGTLSMETRNVHFDDKCGHPGNFIEFSIEDTGTGISPANLPKIFDPFFTTKEVGEGTGMGLPMIQGSVSQHGGFIEVNTVVGKGTKFRLYFPSTGERTEITTKKETGERLVMGTGKILVVEDDESVSRMTVRLLKKCGYNAEAAANAGIAFLKLKKMGKDGEPHIDLVLTDIRMPEMNGTELGKEIEDLYPNTLVVYMSGYPKESNDELGGKPYIPKPFSSLELSREIRKVLDTKKSTKT